MKKELTLGIAQPCAENWNNFTPAEKGRFCGSCSKVVIDFTTASDEEIYQFINQKPAHACGRFRTSQLKTYAASSRTPVRPGLMLLRAGLVSVLLLFVQKSGFTQATSSKPASTEWYSAANYATAETSEQSSQVVRGVVKDEAGNAMPGVSIILVGTNYGVATDEEGRFEFPKELNEGDTLSFHFIGYNTKTVVIEKDITMINLQMNEDDMVLLGAIAVSEPYEKPSILKRSWTAIKNIF